MLACNIIILTVVIVFCLNLFLLKKVRALIAPILILVLQILKTLLVLEVPMAQQLLLQWAEQLLIVMIGMMVQVKV